MGIWFVCELDSYKLHSKQALAKGGSKVLDMVADTVVLAGKAVGKVLDSTWDLVRNSVLDRALRRAAPIWA